MVRHLVHPWPLTAVVLIVGFTGFTVASLSASTLLSAEFREVVADAAVVIRGRVTDVRAVRSDRGEVETVVTIAVDATLKGEAGPFVSMRLPGGTLGRYRTMVPGAPRVALGDQAVFFLKRARGNTLWPVGLSSGLYRIALDPLTRRIVVAPPVVAGVTTAATGRVIRGDTRRGPMPLTEFESLVALVQAAARGDVR